MPCDAVRKPAQTISQRADEVRRAVTSLDALLKKRRVQVRVGPQGAVAFVRVQKAHGVRLRLGESRDRTGGTDGRSCR